MVQNAFENLLFFVLNQTEQRALLQTSSSDMESIFLHWNYFHHLSSGYFVFILLHSLIDINIPIKFLYKINNLLYLEILTLSDSTCRDILPLIGLIRCILDFTKFHTINKHSQNTLPKYRNTQNSRKIEKNITILFVSENPKNFLYNHFSFSMFFIKHLASNILQESKFYFYFYRQKMKLSLI